MPASPACGYLNSKLLGLVPIHITVLYTTLQAHTATERSIQNRSLTPEDSDVLIEQSNSGRQAYPFFNMSTHTTSILGENACMRSGKLLESRTQSWIPKALLNKFCCEHIVPISKLYKTTANSTNTYQLGNIHPISRLRGDVTIHVREVDNIKCETIPLIKNCCWIFPVDNCYM